MSRLQPCAHDPGAPVPDLSRGGTPTGRLACDPKRPLTNGEYYAMPRSLRDLIWIRQRVDSGTATSRIGGSNAVMIAICSAAGDYD